MPTKKSQSYDALLIEQINSKMDLVIEGMTSMETRLIHRMDERLDRMAHSVERHDRELQSMQASH